MDLDLKKIIALSQGEKLEFDTTKTWLDLFTAQVEKNSDKIAVVDENSEMTYKELDELSDKIFAWLLGKGVKENEFVAIRMGRVKEFIAAVVGIWKAGAAYLPIDLEYPAGRIAYMLEDSRAKISLTEKIIFDIAKKNFPQKKIYKTSPENLAYMIYTSGSTGKPKGVMIQHKSLLSFCHSIVKKFGLNEKSRIACHPNFAFDASVEDLYPPLTVGGTVFIVPEETRRDIFEMRKFITDKKINGGNYSTRFGQMLTDEKPLDLDYITLGGEAMTNPPNIRGKVFNGYGPTEFTVGAAYFEVEKGKNYNPIPIGRPLYNCACYIVDEKNNLLPLGEIGELCLAGSQLAKGYWNRPELTAEKFNKIQVGDEKIKVYHTGDLAKYNSDGNLEFCGRIDFQVKLRGFRIELGEIETCAAKFSGIVQVAAEVKNETLCLYYTANKNIDEKSLKNFMAESLTDYMVPQIFIRLEKFPMTPNGKLDKKALPEPIIENKTEYIAPRTEFEKNVVDCMKKILGEKLKIGAADNFFDFGGDSIKAIRLVSLLREQNIFLKAVDVLKLRTVEKIAAVCKFGGEVEINQEPFVGKVEDTAIFNFYKNLNLPDKNYFNQSTLLELKIDLPLQTLQKSFDTLTYQHDMLRAVIIDKHLQVKPADEKILIEEYNLNGEKITDLCEKIQSNLDLEKSLVRAALIHGDSKNFFFLTLHHTIIDGVSWRILLADLETALSGKNLPKKTNTYQDYAAAMKKYRDSYALSLEIPYWKNTLKKMLALETSDGKDFSRQFAELRTSLDKNSTEKFLSAKLSIYNLEVNDLLYAAVAESFHEIFGKDSVSVLAEGHGRENLGAELLTDRTVGWFTSSYPVVFENLSGELQQDLLSVKETLHRVPNKGVGYNILSFVEGKTDLHFEKNRLPQIIFNYLGDLQGEQSGGKFFKPAENFLSGLDYTSKKNVSDPDLMINCLIDDGKFSLWLNYNTKKYSAENAKNFAAEILSNIKKFTAHLDTAEKIVTASDLGETQWSAEEFNAVVEEFSARGEHLQRIYPLTPLQEGILLEHVANPTSPAYRLVDIYELNFLPTEENLRRAIDELSERHEVFRTAIIHEKISIYRQAITDRKIPLTMVDISNEDDKFSAAKKIREKILRDGYDLQKKSLVQFICAKTSESSCYLIIATHHIIVDGWGIYTYLADFEKFLQSPKLEKISEAGLYENAVREIISKDKISAVEHFRKVLDGYENKTEIPSYGKLDDAEKYFDNQIVKIIDAEKVVGLEKICKKFGASLANGLELVWAMVLKTACRLDDVVFAKVVSGRDNISFDVSNLVGLFINSVPVRVKFEKNSSATEILQDLQKQSIEGKDFEFCSLADIQKAVGMTDGLIYSIISVENYEGKKLSLLKPALVREENFGGVGFDATVQADGSISMVISFDQTKYRLREIERLFALMTNYIERISENPAAPLSEIQHLNADDTKKIISLSQGEKLEFDTSKTWLDLFTAQVEKNSDKVSVGDENSEMTYKELDELSDKIFAWLKDKGVQENEFVAIRMGRVKEFIAAVVGIWKAGAAYLPIDLDYPDERVNYMLEDSGAKIILTENLIAEILKTSPQKKIYQTSPENLAYMIYTSGSTGKPKGVMIQHKTLLNLIYSLQKLLNLNEESRVACHPNFAFDASVETLYPSLTVGGTVFIVPEDARRDIFEMRKFISDKKINGGNFSTRFGQMLTVEKPLDLDYIVLGGEAMTNPPNIRGKVFNAYGPTEFTVGAAYFEVEKGKNYNPIPIGRPIFNCACYIVDKNNRLLPRGMVGELCLAGAQISSGYKNRPELTAEKFNKIQIGGEKIKVYHTGDLARYNEDGNLEFCGRIDFQVKLRGFRIELGEIENRAAKFSGIVHAVAEVKKNTLCLYYSAEKNIDEKSLKNFMAESLTDYMVPQIFIRLEKFPMTPSGKIDRKLLPTPDFSVRQTKYEPPQNPIEKKLCDAFTKVLDLEENFVGRDDDFYSLGGDSLKSMLVMTNAGVDGLSAKDIFKYKTAARIAEEISKRSREDINQIELEARKKIIPATTAQIQMIDYQFLHAYSVMYNLGVLYRLNVNLDAEKLAAAINKVAENHPALSSTFSWDDENIVQSVKPGILKKVSVKKFSESELEELFPMLLQPFEIFSKPLFRARVFKTEKNLYLFVDMHHTISDGTSLGILLENIAKAYRGEELAQDFFYSYLLQEHEKFNSEEYKTAKKYFQNLLEGKNWCQVPTPDYDSWDATLGEESIDPEISTEKISTAEKRFGFSRNVFAITAAILALRDYCNETKIRVDFLNNNRTEKYLHHTVGLVFKILPVAVELENYSTIQNLLREISRQVTESFANSICDYSSEDNIALRDALLINYVSDMWNVSALKNFAPENIPLTSDNRAAAGHVDIYLMEQDEKLQIIIEYQKNAYAKDSMKKFLDIFAKHLKILLNGN